LSQGTGGPFVGHRSHAVKDVWLAIIAKASLFVRHWWEKNQKEVRGSIPHQREEAMAYAL
jgi:hypothetical protein